MDCNPHGDFNKNQLYFYDNANFKEITSALKNEYLCSLPDNRP